MTIKELIGELLGTFILVFIGCGTVGLTVLFGTFTNLFQIALLWGIGVSLAIYAVKKICPAHFNPAVSLAFLLNQEISLKQFIGFFLFQILGAFAAASVLYFFLGTHIATHELNQGIIRGYEASKETAMMFGEFYPNPGNPNLSTFPTWLAAILEGAGTYVLVLVIFLITKTRYKIKKWAPVFIGLTVSFLIICIAPYTQAGINPARDFGPRIFASFAGWGEASFPIPFHGFFTVYMLSPLIGGALAKWTYSGLVSNFVKN